MKNNTPAGSNVSAIVWWELRRRKMYLLWWSIGILALVALTVLAYGSIKDQAAELNKAFGGMSSGISSFVGTGDMFSPAGYLNSQLFYITLPILFILLSVTLSGSLLRKEETHGTVELLLARPISRTQLLTAKALSGAVIVLALTVVTAVSIVVCSMAVHIDISIGYLLLTTVFMALFSSAFGAVAFMLYAASRKTRGFAAAAAILLSLGGYIVSSLGGLINGLSGVGKLFPYHYYNPGALLDGHVSRGLILYLVALFVVSIVVAFVGFRRRDIG